MEKGLVFGLNIGDLLEIYDRDSASWKMSGCLFTGDFAKSSGPLPKSGMMRSGRIYAQVTWVRRTDEKEYGLWLTPRAETIEETPENFRERMNRKRPNDRKNGFANLQMQVKANAMFPTHTVNGNYNRRGASKTSGDGLLTVIKRGLDANNAEKDFTEANLDCVKTVKMWPTPDCQNHRDGKVLRKEARGSHAVSLHHAVQMFPTIERERELSDSDSQRLQGREETRHSYESTENREQFTQRQSECNAEHYWSIEPAICGMADGLSDELYGYQGRLAIKPYQRVDRLKGLGNSIVPQIAELLFNQIKPLL